MQDTYLCKRLEALATADSAVQALLVNVRRIHEKACALLKTVPMYMRQYTLHDRVHVDRVIELMGRLLPPDVRDRLGPLEVAALLTVACLHDIGMCVSEEEARQWRKERSAPSSKSSSFTSYRATFPALVDRIQRLRSDGRNDLPEEIESYIEAEFIRKEHASRAKKIIATHFVDFLSYSDLRFVNRIIQVCASHARPPDSLEELPCWELVRTPTPGCQDGERCNWRFVAILLRLADVLDFDSKRTPKVLFEQLGIRDAVSVKEWQKHMAIKAWDITPARISFRAECSDPVIQKAIYQFCDYIDNELVAARVVHDGMHAVEIPDIRDRYAMQLPARVTRTDIGPEQTADGPKYEFVDIQFNLDQHRIVDLLLGIRLYSEAWLFLRELLQNGVDACRHRKALSEAEAGAEYKPFVEVSVANTDNRATLTVTDNGCGMTKRLLCQYFAKVGISYYQSPEFLEDRARTGAKFKPISQFGVGFLSTFMAASAVEVDTLHVSKNDSAWRVSIAGQASLFWVQKSVKTTVGTTVALTLSKSLERILPTSRAVYWRPRGRAVDGLRSGDDDVATWLATVVHNIVGGAEIPVRVLVDGVEASPSETYTKVQFDDAPGHVVAIDFDLDPLQFTGIRGCGRAYFLADRSGAWVKEFSIDRRTEAEDEVVFAWVLKTGAIERAVETELRSGKTQTSWFCEIDSIGRWRQQGILVPAGLLQGYQGMGAGRGLTAPVSLPFPVQYDLDLGEELVLALSVDRRSSVDTDENRRTASNIAEAIVKGILHAAGPAAVTKNRRFLKELLGPLGLSSLATRTS